ncbi:peptidase S58 family protein [Mesobaculum littorinae]|uniref:Peptidase S58 family protein n=1 Tax=Mesobaculum littorinae TaxID=2486419 RepID=A0A438AE31_9RHOB|nr:P1 family peptidase [Mesobaculum littorinae]RVV96902.1 peptidase S58 family protein [Mesobaculum littorinae]
MTDNDTAGAPGPRNLITDVPGLLVGHAADARIKTGVTVLTGRDRLAAAVHVMGGAPGTRETDLLRPENSVERIDAIALSGGSALGLAAGSGVADALRAEGRGHVAAGFAIPIVPGAIIFDLMAGGDTGWQENPYPALGTQALAAADEDFALGTAGAGTGALAGRLKGGVGSASWRLPCGTMVGALVVANPVGSVCHPRTGQFWAAGAEIGAEFGDAGLPPAPGPDLPQTKFAPGAPPPDGAATTIAVVATDAQLGKPALTRMAMAAQDGMARAILPSHTPFDGDLVFAVSTGARPAAADDRALWIGHYAAQCLSRAIARAVHAATPAEGDPFPTWQGWRAAHAASSAV